jgi:hypothetical protein
MKNNLISQINHYFVCLLFVSLAVTQSTFAGELNQLSLGDQERVKNGEQVAVYEDAGTAWPKCKVYQLVSAMPEEAASVFFDFELHSSMFSNITSSKIIKIIDPSTLEVAYKYRLPMGIKPENYVVRDHLSSYDDGNSFVISWTLLSATYAKSSEGSVNFERLDTGTLVTYSSWVVPNFWGASKRWFVESAKQSVKTALNSLIIQIRKEKAEQPQLLEKQLRAFKEALPL